MGDGHIVYRESAEPDEAALVALYRAVGWSAAEKPQRLRQGLLNSDALVTAWDGARLVGLGNALSDGHLVVYYPHLLVHPDYQGQGIGRRLVERLMTRYRGFHQQLLVADGGAVEFYRRCGFERAGSTTPLWIYAGTDH